MGSRRSGLSEAELEAFETATRDLVGLALRSVAEHELSLPQLRLLLVLHDLGTSSSSACAAALGIAGSSVTRMADRLEASGHLVRGADPANRSVVTLGLTDAGRRVVEQVRASRRDQLRHALDRLDPDERAACAATLTRLHAVLDRAADEQPPLRLPL